MATPESDPSRLWKITFSIPEFSFERTYDLDYLTTLGSLIIKATSELNINTDFKKYSIWDPKRECWLIKIKQTLIKSNIRNNYKLEFLSCSSRLNLILPNMLVVACSINTSHPVCVVVHDLCKKLKIKFSEELSLMKVQLDPKLLNQEPISVKDDLDKLDEVELDQKIEELATTLNSSIKSAALADIFPSDTTRTKWARFHSNWFSSLISLKQQGFKENDFIYLRFKYYAFANLDIKHDTNRLYQICNQAFFTLKTEEITCDQSIYTYLIAVWWHMHLVSKGEILEQTNRRTDIKDIDIDSALNRLEQSLERDFRLQTAQKETSNVNITNKTKVLKCSNSSVKSNKEYLTNLENKQLTVTIPPNKKQPGPTHLSMFVKGAKLDWTVSTSKSECKIELYQYPENVTASCGFQKISFLVSCQEFPDWFTALTFQIKDSNPEPHIYKATQKSVLSYLKLKRLLDSDSSSKNSIPAAVQDQGALSFDEMVSKTQLKKHGASELLDQVFAEQESMFGMDMNDSLMLFIRKWMGIRSYDAIPYNVMLNQKTMKGNGVIDISFTNIEISSNNDKKNRHEYPIFALKLWNIQSNNKDERLKFPEHEINLTTNDCPITNFHETLCFMVYNKMRKPPEYVTDVEEFLRKITNTHD